MHLGGGEGAVDDPAVPDGGVGGYIGGRSVEKIVQPAAARRKA